MEKSTRNIVEIKRLILNALAIGMSIASVVLLVLDQGDVKLILTLLSIGMFALSLHMFEREKNDQSRRD